MLKGSSQYIVFLFLALFLNYSWAQEQVFTFSGKVVEGEDQYPIEFVTILLKDKEKGKVVAGTTTKEDGSFFISTQRNDVYAEITFIGFETQLIEDFNFVNGKADLGLLSMKEDITTLDEVEIRAEKSRTEFKLDKRVFNVGRDLSSTGASALEVLNNVPSVNVSIEGAISLRGSEGVQILINGKPSIIASEQGNTLGTITADMIDKIEVITNPSAKYDAEGTSGIINIVIKKEEKKGINGSITLNTGYPNNHSLGFSMNRRTEKFNLFTQIGIGHRTFPGESESINTNLSTGGTVNSLGESEKNETFYNFILGADYHINKTEVITLSGSFAYEQETEFSNTAFERLGQDLSPLSKWNRDESTKAVNPKYRYELQYKKDFKNHKEHDLVFSALGNFFGKDQSSDFVNTTEFGENGLFDQQIATDFKNEEHTFKLDYTNPFSEKFTLETGAQYILNDVANDFSTSNLISGEWEVDQALTNNFEFDQKVLGTYGTMAFEDKKWGLKLGLRLENTQLNTLLTTTNQSNEQNYTNLFPSAHASYKLSEQVSVQAGYSKRIFRPRLWDLNPFFNIRNNFRVRTGNPNLLPEFTDSYEITSIYAFEKFSMNVGIYHRYTTDVVERVSTFSDDISITRPENIGTNRATGIEFNGKYSPAKWLSMNGDFNYLYFNRQGSLDTQSFDFNGDQWSAKLTSKFKLPAKIDFEVTGQYRSRFKTVQSEISGYLFADMGLRKKLLKGRAILNFSVRDIFASRIRESNTFQPSFYLYSYSRRGRFMTFGFSYGFGKGEAMEFSAQKRR